MPSVALLAPGGSLPGPMTDPMVEDPARGNPSRLGGAIRGGEYKRRAEETAKLGLESAIAVGEPLDPLLLLLGTFPQLAVLLIESGLALPGLREFAFELPKPPSRNGYEVVLLWGEEERKGLCEDRGHAPGRGRRSSMNPSVERKRTMLRVAIRAARALRQPAPGT